MNEVLTTQFLETLSDIGALQLYVSEKNGIISTFFTGPSEKFVQIQSSLEYMPEKLGSAYLVQLGLSEYVERIYPGFLDRYKEERDKLANSEIENGED
ncbi:hypothetical protein [Pedobacter ureilyticus]|uniref:KTSC domain-containing protein n=1 Tax=Pedobacter ureilyticus TaxID=1393051 RepID=A0ABW9J5R3_9SPHI|nr:hypothetical protein [Pedobacter helvus]